MGHTGAIAIFSIRPEPVRGLEKSINLLSTSKKEEVTILWVCRNKGSGRQENPSPIYLG